MDELKIRSPVRKEVEDWEVEAREAFGEQQILGRLETSVDLRVVSVDSGRLKGQSFERIKPYIQEPRLLACFKDISSYEIADYRADGVFERRKEDIGEQFENGFWNVAAYLDNIYDAVPNRDVSVKFFSKELDMQNLEYNTTVTKDIEEAMREDSDFSVTEVRLDARSENDYAVKAYSTVDDRLAFVVDFLYTGDEEAVEEYNEVVLSSEKECPGIPGRVAIGQTERPYADLEGSDETSIEYDRVDDWLEDSLDSTWI